MPLAEEERTMGELPPFPYEGPGELAPVVLKALRRVVDPEVALNIVDVGLVYGVRVRSEEVEVDVTMTSAACPVADVILGDIVFELEQALPEAMAVEPRLVWEPAWTPERLSPNARRFMGW
jgi:metal-sulfur cluster biosynthetic enzyme